MAKALLGHLGANSGASRDRIHALNARVVELQALCERLSAENDELRAELNLRDTLSQIDRDTLSAIGPIS